MTETSSWTAAQIVEELAHHDGRFPREALLEAERRGQELGPALLQVLEKSVQKAARFGVPPGTMLPVYALFLLARLREPKAELNALRFFALPSNVLDTWGAPLLRESAPRLLASVWGGKPQSLQKLILAPAIDWRSRAAAIEAFVVLVAQDAMDRKEALTFFKALFRQGLARKPSELWAALIWCATRIYPDMVYKDIEKAFEDGLPLRSHIRLDYVQTFLLLGLEKSRARLISPKTRYIDDVVAELEWWPQLSG